MLLAAAALSCSCSSHDSRYHSAAKITPATARKTLDSLNCDVVYVVLDAFHANHASLYGYRRQTTPFLNQLKHKSVVFANFFAHSPYTLASTATLLTSKYPFQHGLVSKETRLLDDLETLPKVLAGHMVDSHLVSDHPFICGKEWGLSSDYTEVHQLKLCSYKKDPGVIADTLRALYQRKRPHRRYFLYMHFIPPHLSFVPPKDFMVFDTPYADRVEKTSEFMARARTRPAALTESELDYLESVYDANVLFADSIARRIYDFFESSGLLERTVLIFASDHGEACKLQHGELGHNTTIYDEMIHIPFIVVLPEKVERKDVMISAVSGIIHAAPTIVDIFGIDAVEAFEGRSLLPQILGDSTSRPDPYVFLHNPLKKQLGIRDARYKYIETPSRSMLFDLDRDPKERNDISKTEPGIVAHYRRLIGEQYYSRQVVAHAGEVNPDSLNDEQKRQLRTLGYLK